LTCITKFVKQNCPRGRGGSGGTTAETPGRISRTETDGELETGVVQDPS